MFRNLLQPKTLFKNTLAALLVITLSGAYCLFCCQEIKAAAKTEHCPLKRVSETEHCNFAKDKSAGLPETATSINLFECCGLKFNFFVAKLEKNQLPQQTPVLANNFSNFLESVKLENKTGFTDFFYHAPAFEKGARHIRNCVFRI
jgi:hypothetical protein